MSASERIAIDGGGSVRPMHATLSALFLTAAGPGIGLGHLRRCMALAGALRERGATVNLAAAGTPGGTLCVADPEPAGMEFLEWTGEVGLALDAVARHRPDTVIVDSYAATPDLIARLRRRGVYMVVVDDLGDRVLPADLVVNGAFHAETIPYCGLPETTFLLGPRYMPLDLAFAKPPRHRPVDAVNRVLVTLGGDGGGDVLKFVLATVRRAVPEALIDVVLGPFAPVAEKEEERTRVHRGRSSLRDLMVRADMAVTAAGVTLFECLAAGAPTVALCLADNQRPNVLALGAAGLILPGDDRLEAAIVELVRNKSLRARLSLRGREIVDGQGARRVAAHIAQACAHPE